jgi:nucleotide-binding universal stress UspA family protein
MTTRGNEIIVGYDGSEGSAEALDWAMREARFRRLELTVCHAWTSGYEPAGGDAGQTGLPRAQADAVDLARERGAEVLAAGVRHAQACDPAVTPRPLLVCGRPAGALCEQCSGSDMIVVGSRGIGGLPGLLLGSVSLQVAAHARVPVTVVRGRGRPVYGQPRLPVVAGVDGSPGSRAALEFSVAEAALLDVPLVAVCALCDAAGVFGAAHSIEAEFMTVMGKVAADHPEVVVQKLVEQGAPLPALLAAAAQGQLLVVGARGRRGLREMMLGSVSLAVLHHAACPVTVVHGG